MVSNSIDVASAGARKGDLRIKTVVLGIAAIGTIAAGALSAQGATAIKTDASWGRTARVLAPTASATTVTGNKGTVYQVPGNVYTIPESAGKTAGSNLFHSFESFSVGQGDAAVFTTRTPSLTNVISRVSGLSATSIEGLLALQPAPGSHPNFFLINPNGITFSAGAQVDVPAAFHATTAKQLNFANEIQRDDI
jgi:filamentous hemagglutinin family protein